MHETTIGTNEHPIKNNTFHLRNYWYIGGYSEEVGRKPLARRMLDRPIVMYRLQDVTVAAIEDRCPHRRALLSSGKIIGVSAGVALTVAVFF